MIACFHVYINLRVILKNDMCEKMLAFVRKLVVMHFLTSFLLTF